MRPPDCHVCHLSGSDVPDDGRSYFTLVRFGETEQEKMVPSRAMAAQERTGHPYNAVWFCNDHVALARRYENRHTSEALAAIDALLPARPGKALQGQRFSVAELPRLDGPGLPKLRPGANLTRGVLVSCPLPGPVTPPKWR